MTRRGARRAAPAELVVRLPALHAGQQRIVDTAAQFNVVMCGRRFGKTLLGQDRAVDKLLDPVAAAPVGWFAPTHKILLQAWVELQRVLAPVIRRSNETDRRLELVTGMVLECWSLERPDAGRSREYGRVIIDEAGVVRDLQARWEQDISPTLAKFDGDAWFLGTPKGRSSYFSKLFIRGETGETGFASFRARTLDNPFIPRAFLERERRLKPAEIFAQEYEGVPAPDGGNPFGLDAIARCAGPRSLAPTVVWGWDVASAEDWTVGVGLDRTGRWTQVVRFQRPWPETKAAILSATADAHALVDATGVGAPVLQDLQQGRSNFTGFVFTRTSKQELMVQLRNALQLGTVVIPDGASDPSGAGALRSELEAFEYAYTASGVRYAAPEGLHDDCVMALALAVRALTQPKAPTGGDLVTL